MRKSDWLQLFAQPEEPAQAGENAGDTAPDAGERQEDFEDLIRGRYKADFDARVRKILDGRLRGLRQEVAQLAVLAAAKVTGQALDQDSDRAMAEQFLSVSMGMADTLMVSGVGEAAVSSVSLVDSLNILIIQILSALATGGAVISSQYLGRRDGEKAAKSAAQLYTVLAVSTIAVMLVILVLSRPILPMAGMPAGGFIVLGVLCAVWRTLARKYKNYLTSEARGLMAVYRQKEGEPEDE